MKNIFAKIILTTFTLVILMSCEEPSTDPIKSMEEISKSYKKSKTHSEGEIDSHVQLARRHYDEYTSRYKSARDVSGAGYDVGVIPDVAGCPLSSELVLIVLDNENDAPTTSNSGWTGAWTTEVGAETYMRFCKVDGRLFQSMKGSFSVLKLGTNNPPGTGSIEFGFSGVNLLLMDNQDNGHTRIENLAAGVGPNFVDGHKNLRLYFIHFNFTGHPYPTVPTPFPDLGFSYGVFGWTQLSIATGLYFTDDEDDDCKTDDAIISGSGLGIGTTFQIVRTGGQGEPQGTNFRMSKVK